jgi:hypothetical protein
MSQSCNSGGLKLCNYTRFIIENRLCIHSILISTLRYSLSLSLLLRKKRKIMYIFLSYKTSSSINRALYICRFNVFHQVWILPYFNGLTSRAQTFLFHILLMLVLFSFPFFSFYGKERVKRVKNICICVYIQTNLAYLFINEAH